jgi:hypothetical protein
MTDNQENITNSANTLAPTPQSIVPLTMEGLFTNAQYVIPIYQRNYAWGEVEVEQLIQDIYDQSLQAKDKNYYLGSLVVFLRPKQLNDTSDVYETIDGQQRHTTLSILLAVLKNKFSCSLDTIKQVNLYFDSRLKSQNTIQALYAHGKKDHLIIEQESAMLDAYSIASAYLTKLFGKDPISKNKALTDFCRYLTHNVIIVRSPVPKDTDLNHYFEIMNNRGEQLEKHEVLKAQLMNQLEKQQQLAFAKIWDACSHMDKYVQYGFSSDIRKSIFGIGLNDTKDIFSGKEGFEKIIGYFNAELEKIAEKDNSSARTSVAKPALNRIEDIFKAARKSVEASTEDNNGEEQFGSTINFPNFLLQTLKVLDNGVSSESDIPLDDKRLLDVFSKQKVDPSLFIMSLLKARFLFDKYLIKRERDKDWSLKRMKYYADNKQINYVNTFGSEDTEGDATQVNHRIKMLLSMLHVSFPTMLYKNWFNGVLQYLFNANSAPSAEEYLTMLENYNDRIFYGLFGSRSDDAEGFNFHRIIYTEDAVATKFNESELRRGTGVQNYIFNRLDYEIWKECLFGNIKLTINTKRDMARICKSFSFSMRSSVEHYYPQNPIDEQPRLISSKLSKGVDSFGNLCLISSSKNARLNNLMPRAKRDHYPPYEKNVESLKQQLMMSYDEWDSAHADNIRSHEEVMVLLLTKRYCTK